MTLDQNRPLLSAVRLLGAHRWRVVLAVFCFIAKDSPMWLMPLVTARVIDLVVAEEPTDEVFVLALLGAFVIVQNYPMQLAFTRFYMGAVRAAAARLRNMLAARLQALSIGFHARQSASVLQTKVVRDVENIEQMLTQGGAQTLSSVFVCIGAVTMTAVNVPEFLPVFALCVPLGVGIWKAARSRSRVRNEDFRKEVEKYSARVGEMTSLIKVTRAHGLEEVAQERVEEVADSLKTRGLRLDMFNSSVASMSWVAMQLLALLCLCGAAILSLSGTLSITPGQVVLMSTYFLTLTASVTGLLGLYPLIARGSESVRSLCEVLQDPDVEFNAGKAVLHSTKGGIELRGVSVQFPGSDDLALQAIDLTIPPGETVAFVGSSGSGKSTLVNTVLGFVRPTAGTVLLDGRDASELDMRAVRRHVSVVPQESVLFEGSVRENVAYGLRNASRERVEAALRDAHAAEFVRHLPQGMDTVVGQHGARLSGGQRQRLAIARALIRDPKILLLDEATSALDAGSERAVQAALDNLMAGRTTLVVAHRLSTIRNADRIVVLERGVLVEQGTHAELLRSGGRYRAMWDMQFSETPVSEEA